MKVTTITPHGNPRGGFYWKEAGVVYDLPDAEAAGLIRDGVVEEAPAEAEAETPTPPADAPEAAEPKGKAGKGAPDQD